MKVHTDTEPSLSGSDRFHPCYGVFVMRDKISGISRPPNPVHRTLTVVSTKFGGEAESVTFTVSVMLPVFPAV